jgi:hypothetical protein
MKWKTLSGKLKDVATPQYSIDWDGDFASKLEEEIADWFYPYWKGDIVTAQFPIPGTKMSLDFFNVSRRIAIEGQGRQHSEYTPFLSRSRAGYLSQIKRDESKRKWCDLNGVTLIEIHPSNLPLTKEWVEETYSITL